MWFNILWGAGGIVFFPFSPAGFYDRRIIELQASCN